MPAKKRSAKKVPAKGAPRRSKKPPAKADEFPPLPPGWLVEPPPAPPGESLLESIERLQSVGVPIVLPPRPAWWKRFWHWFLTH